MSELLRMLRAAVEDERLSSGTLYREAADEIERLLRWKSTHAPRLAALEGLLKAAQVEAHKGLEARMSLASEREANALLTAEIERMNGIVQAALKLNDQMTAALRARLEVKP